MVEVDLWKKKTTKELTEGEFRLRVVELMGMLVGEAEEINQGITLSNVLRQRSLVLWEVGIVTGNPQVSGELPVPIPEETRTRRHRYRFTRGFLT